MNVMWLSLVWAVGIKNPHDTILLGGSCPRAIAPHLESARSSTFHSDASKNRLLLLRLFCGVDHQPRQGLLGTQSLGDDSSAAGLAVVILRILKSLCTPLSGAPIDKSAKYNN